MLKFFSQGITIAVDMAGSLLSWLRARFVERRLIFPRLCSEFLFIFGANIHLALSNTHAHTHSQCRLETQLSAFCLEGTFCFAALGGKTKCTIAF